MKMAEYQECGGGGFIGRGMNSRVGGSIVEKEGECGMMLFIIPYHIILSGFLMV